MTTEIYEQGLTLLNDIKVEIAKPQLTHENLRLKELERVGILIDIAEYLGYQSWDILTADEKKYAYFNYLNKNYHMANAFIMGDANRWYVGFKRVGTKKGNENFTA